MTLRMIEPNLPASGEKTIRRKNLGTVYINLTD